MMLIYDDEPVKPSSSSIHSSETSNAQILFRNLSSTKIQETAGYNASGESDHNFMEQIQDIRAQTPQHLT